MGMIRSGGKIFIASIVFGHMEPCSSFHSSLPYKGLQISLPLERGGRLHSGCSLRYSGHIFDSKSHKSLFHSSPSSDRGRISLLCEDNRERKKSNNTGKKDKQNNTKNFLPDGWKPFDGVSAPLLQNDVAILCMYSLFNSIVDDAMSGVKAQFGWTMADVEQLARYFTDAASMGIAWAVAGTITSLFKQVNMPWFTACSCTHVHFKVVCELQNQSELVAQY